ncbi:uncharacterized protein LOC129602131 [Paramacrobiotus metropolitanus]|uniref:uncharacterized protein LOC129602131 n=1 Tax=Paramacrobiotus metropolitanus TaxID=2943436 RepID=UPI0024461124|nr:uncharacterized protein LOC129602131 [Paramacrobiotus metropolitanus]
MAPLHSSRSPGPSSDESLSEPDDEPLISMATPSPSPSDHHPHHHLPLKLPSHHRFTVSPVSPESEPLLRPGGGSSATNPFLTVPGDPPADDVTFLELARRGTRDRHPSARSDVTDETLLDDEEEQELSDIPVCPPDDLATGTDTGHLRQGCYDNAGLLPSPGIPTPEPTALQPGPDPGIPYPRGIPPLIITSHPSDASLPPPLPDSLQASHWDIGPGGGGLPPSGRNPAVQFYVGSCLSVSSAASSISFFNTLYAHGYTPICRICHQPASDKRPLITPCHCTGSLRFVHHSCLMRWLDTRTKQLGHNPKCELCVYQFRARRHWRSLSSVRWPAIPTRDKVLHGIFFLALVVMGVCLGVIGSVFKGQPPTVETEPRSGETVTLVCGIVFFVAFFAATLAQIKASWNVWRLLRIFWDNNYVMQLENDLSVGQKESNRVRA